MTRGTWNYFFVGNECEWAWQMRLKSLFCRFQPSFVEKLVWEKICIKKEENLIWTTGRIGSVNGTTLCPTLSSSRQRLRFFCLLMNKSSKNGKRKFYFWMKKMIMYIQADGVDGLLAVLIDVQLLCSATKVGSELSWIFANECIEKECFYFY